MTAELEDQPDRAETVRLNLQNTLRYGLSQRRFSSITGIPRSTLGDFLRGTHAPSETTLQRLEAQLYPDGAPEFDE